MKILYISHRIPYPPNKGEKIRTFHQIRHLAKRHTIHLCSFADNKKELLAANALKKYCASVDVIFRRRIATNMLATLALFRMQTISVAAFWRKSLDAIVHRKLETDEFDCIMVSCAVMAQYVPRNLPFPTIIDFIDVDSAKWLMYAERHVVPFSTIYKIESVRLAEYEEQVLRHSDHAIVISEEERRAIRNRVVGRSISVVGNGVDLEYFTLPVTPSNESPEMAIVFTGVMDYFPNIDAVKYFCRHIFPLIRRAVPEARFYIVGRNPTRDVKRLATEGNVVVTGEVADVRPFLARAIVAVAPFRLARGVQNKVLEAMAMGVPVVGTTQTFKGIEASESDGVRIVDDADSFARQVICFLRDQEQRFHAAQRVRNYVERHHRWEEQGLKLEVVLERAVSRAQKRDSYGSGAG